MMQMIGSTKQWVLPLSWWTLSLLGLVDSICYTAQPDPLHIFRTDPSHISQKPTYHVQSSLRMRTLRLKILQRYPILKQPSMWTTASMLSRQSYLTHSHLLNSQNLVCEVFFDIASNFFLMDGKLMGWDIQAITKLSYWEESVSPSSPEHMKAVGHRAIFLTLSNLREWIWWPMLDEDVKWLFLHAILVRLGRPIIFTCHWLFLKLCSPARFT